jgi:hypothetical protein
MGSTPKMYPIEELTDCLDQINQIPANEIKYYLLLLLKTIEEGDQNKLFMADLLGITQALTQFLKAKSIKESERLLEEISAAYQSLRNNSKTNSCTLQFGYALINLGSILVAFLGGIIGGLVGATAGLMRAFYTLNNPVVFFADGLITGLTFGAAIGFRAPKKLLKDEFTRRLKLCLDKIENCVENLKKESIPPLSHYENQVKARLLQNCFGNNEEAYQVFLASEQEFEISTVAASFLSQQLNGYLGHHARIRIKLPGQSQPEIIEYAPKTNKIDNRPSSQSEKRRVSGQAIVNMLALHKQLWVTEGCTLNHIFTTMKVGENDCLTYVNKILEGTGQEATICRRFDGTENSVGRNVIRFFVNGLTPFPEESRSCINNSDCLLN